ncbi:bifunctional 2-keto-4-hydroxyglutarate aldolase/2-keto-3-deoxy-6-phosphogluconate aldolase [Clostridium sp. AM58-1XD]|uniref:bifunctional 2-keto-4-hydroxyglutarate aldolase/2-keto-3-deoxy-6-phosphogluconate aldolase n=1 Tax=Clostridium sp. AM58-1XD TaxID=2292307 RepID=UPI000E4AEB53|nr:bifunctional 2-keto-4-hydroxyglutarate aldolase/2-keto-3-deoxy-6-phosphogluconate aldolase [Clostridium sp. AM58-1XD]RGZ00377.1 bifunctional 4-hydroxy-2-oxoglutarate aldolase/2-dehydro-3-deoxy-phosphogluconate aldolase [Clostridium sp. AM58-1XD]
MKKEQVIIKIKEQGIVAVIRAESKEEGERIIDAVVSGGISLIEITMTVPNAVSIIEAMVKKYETRRNVVIGAGTVLDGATARHVILAGAAFVVSPGFSLETATMCNRYCVPYLPGVMTPTEAVTALEAGCSILKIFPGNVVGPEAIRSLKGPLPQGDYMPTGGVDIDNVEQWIAAGACAVGTGSSLTKGTDYQAITDRARRFTEAVHTARSNVLEHGR